MPIRKKRRHRRRTLKGVLLIFLFFIAVVFGTHAAFLRLPYHWDELGQFVPAALDLYSGGHWIPRSTTPNAHPPGVMAYLALAWTVAGYSVAATRGAMLLLAAASVLVVFLLAVELCRDVRGLPAAVAVLFLCVSPMFMTQAMLAQLDMPAMLLTALALLLFLKDKIAWCAAVSTALVMTKETGGIVVAVLVLTLIVERRFRQAGYFVFPIAALAVWLVILAGSTGHVFGSTEFTDYNAQYLLHPVRMLVAFARRVYFLFFENLHWVGTLAILYAWRQSPLFQGRAWTIAWVLIASHVLLFSVLGGAMLERYLLPVLPLVYIAMAAASTSLPGPARALAPLLLLAGLFAFNFWNPPYPFPFENNLSMVDFVELQQKAAQYVDDRQPNARITTAWPLSDALRRPEFGYVRRARLVEPLRDFSSASLSSVDPNQVQVFILFTREWNPPASLMRFPPAEKFWRRFFGYRSQVTEADVESQLGVRLVAGWISNGLWAQVFVKPLGAGPAGLP